jgi:hypothetical protein
MARKFMTKEVTFTIVKAGTIAIDENGLPKVEALAPITLMGEVDKTRAQKLINKQGVNGQVFAVETKTEKYKMKVEDFIKIATLVQDGDEEEEDEDESENE